MVVVDWRSGGLITIRDKICWSIGGDFIATICRSERSGSGKSLPNSVELIGFISKCHLVDLPIAISGVIICWQTIKRYLSYGVRGLRMRSLLYGVR
ncbi:hypothetical protein GQ457_02G008800 [Hibiscus cannabinus]